MKRLFLTLIFVGFSSCKLFINPYPRLETHSGSYGQFTDDDVLYITPLLESGKPVKDIQKMASISHEDLNNFPGYSGFFTVNKTFNSNMFFWYFPAQIDAANAPVVLWLQGESFFSIIKLN